MKTSAEEVRVGVAPNDLTRTEDKDFFAGAPQHKLVPARLEKKLCNTRLLFVNCQASDIYANLIAKED